MRPILSATGTYNYALAKWLDEKLKPLSVNRYTISDTFSFAEEIQNLVIDQNDILVSFDVTSLFTNTGNFYIFHIGLKMVNFGGFLGISVGFSQTGKVLPKPRMALIKPISTPGIGLY